MEVIKVKIDIDAHIGQERFWTDKATYYSGLGKYQYVRFKLLEAYTDDIMSLHHMHEHGLKGNLQGVQSCPTELQEFLLNPYQTANDDVYDVDYPAEDEELYEGAVIKVLANKYERNQKARKECIAKDVSVWFADWTLKKRMEKKGATLFTFIMWFLSQVLVKSIN